MSQLLKLTESWQGHETFYSAESMLSESAIDCTRRGS
jgi:hypothetical protein